MNFLAHVYLSDNNPERQIGNFIADAIKGQDYMLFDGEIRLGILLHRKIDAFTDTHPIFRQSVRRLFYKYRHYSPVIVDMFYDHFLAKHFSTFHETPLNQFIEQFYQQLQLNFAILPARTQKIVPILLSENWLSKYQTLEGLQEILGQMDRRKTKKSVMHESVAELRTDYALFEKDFFQFMPIISEYATKQAKHLCLNNT